VSRGLATVRFHEHPREVLKPGAKVVQEFTRDRGEARLRQFDAVTDERDRLRIEIDLPRISPTPER
jgi:hypothetical protein